MKAFVKTAPGYDMMEMQEIEKPTAYDDKVVIKVEYTGICGSDIHTFKGEYKNPKTPVVLGHEFSGTIVEVGPDVTDYKVGDRVVSETTFEVCNECRFCKSKDYNLCAHRKGIGTQVNGSMTDYVLARQESLHLIPDNVSFMSAAFAEPLSCCTHAVMEKTEINEGEVVLIIGPGPIGLLAAQVAKANGGKVILSGITRDMPRLQFAKDTLGIDYICDSQTEDLNKLVLDLTDGYGADKVIDASGAVPAVNQALKLTAKKGTFVQLGLFAKDNVEIDTNSIIQREINYIGSRSQKPSAWIKSLKLMEEEKVNLEAMVTKVFPLEQAREAFEAVMAGNEIKVMIKSSK
ncbi:zinc-binding dehydrogenase [Eremococcus coleocola]|uniref:Putative chlorophyll synthesis pathway protein BchC n=1 Tax=Eremococcus coleocola ACS-139-V-Col8 TaxID=908337 RepID=E4KN68_9LACT|nr:zinc-binding dehydrogenase [Eremococcus coleocola]EFR31734.1 putative chlorophyll synthesis pathway protein BchC [Eremococcus coleocola ACS-139-V-Col8]